MADVEGSAPRGGLTLKGGVSLKKLREEKKKKKHSRRKEEKQAKKERRERGKRQRKPEEGEEASGAAEQEPPPPERRVGTGRISTSGITVAGKEGTRFQTELDPGDALIVNHPTSLQEEVRMVTMVLSDSSVGISSPFSSDLITGTMFEYIKKPRVEETEEEKQAKRRKKSEEEEKLAFGTYASEGGKTLTYRVRSATAYGGYQLVTKRLDSEMSREQLLEERCKHKSDRHCY